ncbi:DegPprotease 7 [Striga asiatica]|uniref:DegPprotease 7 n=1 Tax=Striga asiatica TaxID=4170 RepID=A0A5A7RIW0_STRAF|nr:DegPprotease 7 [Striga asiatica]
MDKGISPNRSLSERINSCRLLNKPNSRGTVPLNRFEAKFRRVRPFSFASKYVRLLMSPISLGMSPLRLLLPIRTLDKVQQLKLIVQAQLIRDEASQAVKILRPVKLATHEGIVPFSLFVKRCKDSSFFKLSSSFGISPVRKLLERCKALRFLSLENSEGIGPSKLLNDKSRNSSSDSSARAGGIKPLKLLNERSRDFKDLSCEIKVKLPRKPWLERSRDSTNELLQEMPGWMQKSEVF